MNKLYINNIRIPSLRILRIFSRAIPHCDKRLRDAYGQGVSTCIVGEVLNCLVLKTVSTVQTAVLLHGVRLWRCAVHGILRTDLCTVPAANTGVRNPIALRFQNRVAYSEIFPCNRSGRQAKIFNSIILDDKYRINVFCFTGINMFKIRLFLIQNVPPLYLLVLIDLHSLPRHAKGFLIFCVTANLYPAVCIKLPGKRFPARRPHRPSQNSKHRYIPVFHTS